MIFCHIVKHLCYTNIYAENSRKCLKKIQIYSLKTQKMEKKNGVYDFYARFSELVSVNFCVK